MIAFVRGSVAQAAVDHLVVDMGAIGVTVQCTPVTALSVRAGEHVELATTMVVREDGWTLYGFTDLDERTVFEQVQTVSGIGPRIALALLGTLSPEDLRRAVATSDEAALMKVSGIGRKGAQRIILELADRLGAPSGASAGDERSSAAPAGGWAAAVSAGLTSLGWSPREAEAAVGALDPELAAAATAAGDQADIGALLKAALRGLDRS
jgi:Holliday junction DNA helicase RuvA